MDRAPIGDARFFARSGPHALAVVAEAAGGTAGKINLLIDGLAPLQTAGPNDVSFLDSRRYVSALEQTLAGAVIVRPEMQACVPVATVPILTTEPHVGWARVAALFHPMPPVSPGVHPSAFVAEDAEVDPSAEIGPLCVIEAGARIGPGCRIGPCAVIGIGVVIGRDCRIGAHASMQPRARRCARLRLSRRAHRARGIWIWPHQNWVLDGAPTRPGDPRRRRRGRRQYDDRSRIDSRHADRRRFASR